MTARIVLRLRVVYSTKTVVINKVDSPASRYASFTREKLLVPLLSNVSRFGTKNPLQPTTTNRSLILQFLFLIKRKRFQRIKSLLLTITTKIPYTVINSQDLMAMRVETAFVYVIYVQSEAER